jgi:hypothetical protein
MAPPGQPLPPKSVGRKPGKGQRCHDYYLIPLCVECHQALHAKSGQFKDWSKQRLDAWQLEQVTYHRFLWDEAQGTEESTQAWLDGLPF